MNKELKKVKKFYKKLLNSYNKYFDCSDNSLNYFISFLRYLRDTAILLTDFNNLNNQVLSTLGYAISEYFLANECINNYYIVTSRQTIRKDQTKTESEVQAEFGAEKQIHINNFLQLVKDNYNTWIEEYGN